MSVRIAGTTSCRTHWWNWLSSHIRYSGEPAFADHRLAGDAVAGVELDPARLDQRPAGADQAVALDLLGVAARGREDQHRGAVVAPPGQTDRLLQPLGVPAVGHLHVVHPDTVAATRQRDGLPTSRFRANLTSSSTDDGRRPAWARRSRPGPSPAADRQRYREKLRRCLDVFGRMLNESKFDFERPLTGLEIEFNLVDADQDPAMRNEEVLAAIADEVFQTELGQFNIEINVPPAARWPARPPRSSRPSCGPASTTPRSAPGRSARTSS